MLQWTRLKEMQVNYIKLEVLSEVRPEENIIIFISKHKEEAVTNNAQRT